ncbi:MAG: prepilin-type N-terminal cleavage/methylation domain-containing protein [Verrucomicrobia bacterium]|nr:prepilin-type N-terminal cleavage/methylation domain-containing protein [Verrucomicrobiota bacterium]
MRSRTGFTLAEIVIAMAITGISLAGIVAGHIFASR